MRLKLAQTCVYLSQKHIYFKTNVNVDAHRLLFLLVGDLLTIRFQCLVKFTIFSLENKYITNGILCIL